MHMLYWQLSSIRLVKCNTSTEGYDHNHLNLLFRNALGRCFPTGALGKTTGTCVQPACPMEDLDISHARAIHSGPQPCVLAGGVRCLQNYLHCQVVSYDNHSNLIEVQAKVGDHPHDRQSLQLRDAVIVLSCGEGTTCACNRVQFLIILSLAQDGTNALDAGIRLQHAAAATNLLFSNSAVDSMGMFFLAGRASTMLHGVDQPHQCSKVGRGGP